MDSATSYSTGSEGSAGVSSQSGTNLYRQHDINLPVNSLSLTFNGSYKWLEPEFMKYYCRVSVRLYRWAVCIGMLMYGFFIFLDMATMPDLLHRFMFIRFCVIMPLLSAGLLFSFYSGFERLWQASIAFVILSAAFGILWMILEAYPPFSETYYVGLILVMFFSNTFMRARFVWGVVLSLIILIMFEITYGWLVPLERRIFIENNFFFISNLMVGLMACYCVELYLRKDFFLMYMLHEEKAKLATLNDHLRLKIDELEEAQKEINTLSGLIPICARCKKIRDDKGYWNQIESYIAAHSDAVFSHAMCPDCMEDLYGQEEWFRGEPARTPGDAGGSRHCRPGH